MRAWGERERERKREIGEKERKREREREIDRERERERERDEVNRRMRTIRFACLERASDQNRWEVNAILLFD
jgi:hypothetical protein